MAVPAPAPSGGDSPLPADASTRDRLLAAAYELLTARGYQATTVQAVARRAGLTTGAIYANFVGKQDLMAHAVLAEWYRAELAAMAEQVTDLAPATDPDGSPTAAAVPTDLDPEDLTRVMAHHVASAPGPRHRLITEVTGAVVRDDLGESPLLASVKVIEQLTRSSVEQGKARGEVAAELDTDALVAVIVNVYLGAITSKALGLPQPDLAETLRVMRAANAGYAAGWPPPN